MAGLDEQVKKCKKNDVYVQKINEILKKKESQENIFFGLYNRLEFRHVYCDYELYGRPEGLEMVADLYKFIVSKGDEVLFSGRIELDKKLSCYQARFNYNKNDNELNDDIVQLFKEGIG